MVKNEKKIKKGEIVIYKAKDGPRLDVHLENDTIWLDTHQIANLFDVDRTGIYYFCWL